MNESEEVGAAVGSTGRVVVLGCGFAGRAVALEGIARGREVLATTRRAERALDLGRSGLSTVVSELPGKLGEILLPSDCVMVAFPPDGSTDHGMADLIGIGRRIVYVSSTSVYGDWRGRVDGTTPTSKTNARARARLDAERAYLDIGGVVLRAPAIYGPGRGLHERLASGRFRLPGDGTKVVSRIHVDDLATFVLAAFERGERGSVYTVADDSPVSQREVVAWLCAERSLPWPASAPLDEVDETLRHDRSVDGSVAKAALGVSLKYPSYREGFRACFAESRQG